MSANNENIKSNTYREWFNKTTKNGLFDLFHQKLFDLNMIYYKVKNKDIDLFRLDGALKSLLEECNTYNDSRKQGNSDIDDKTFLSRINESLEDLYKEEDNTGFKKLMDLSVDYTKNKRIEIIHTYIWDTRFFIVATLFAVFFSRLVMARYFHFYALDQFVHYINFDSMSKTYWFYTCIFYFIAVVFDVIYIFITLLFLKHILYITQKNKHFINYKGRASIILGICFIVQMLVLLLSYWIPTSYKLDVLLVITLMIFISTIVLCIYLPFYLDDSYNLTISHKWFKLIHYLLCIIVVVCTPIILYAFNGNGFGYSNWEVFLNTLIYIGAIIIFNLLFLYLDYINNNSKWLFLFLSMLISLWVLSNSFNGTDWIARQLFNRYNDNERSIMELDTTVGDSRSYTDRLKLLGMRELSKLADISVNQRYYDTSNTTLSRFIYTQMMNPLAVNDVRNIIEILNGDTPLNTKLELRDNYDSCINGKSFNCTAWDVEVKHKQQFLSNKTFYKECDNVSCRFFIFGVFAYVDNNGVIIFNASPHSLSVQRDMLENNNRSSLRVIRRYKIDDVNDFNQYVKDAQLVKIK